MRTANRRRTQYLGNPSLFHCARRIAAGMALSPAVEVAAYRILTEAITNVARHAHATGVDIRFFGDGHWLSLVVRDNGCGMKPGVVESPTSFGLSQLRERASTLGGFAQIESKPGQGTTVRIALPVSRPENGSLSEGASESGMESWKNRGGGE